MSARGPEPIPDPQPIRHLLLYGTLCAGEPAHERFGLRAALTLVGRRSVPGTLYDLGAYPGLVLGAGTVDAELYRIGDPGIVARLDRYEGYDARAARASLFARRAVRVPRHTGATAGTLGAWVYAYNGPVAGAPAIRATTWREHRRGRG